MRSQSGLAKERKGRYWLGLRKGGVRAEMCSGCTVLRFCRLVLPCHSHSAWIRVRVRFGTQAKLMVAARIMVNIAARIMVRVRREF